MRFKLRHTTDDGGETQGRPPVRESRLYVRVVASLAALPGRVHRDERGTISILTVFCLLMFTMLLVMIVNVARHLDDKIQMQNSADAATYSGGVVLARGMNALAYSNHLLADTFAITAFLREGRDRTAEQLTPEILTEWEQVASKFQGAEFQKFAELGQALQEKVPQERELVKAYGDLNQVAAEHALDVFEMILAEQLIHQFQRSVVFTLPGLAQETAAEIAYRDGLTQKELEQYSGGGNAGGTQGGRSAQTAVLWRGDAVQIGDNVEDDPITRTLPAVDPCRQCSDYYRVPLAEEYFDLAVRQRRQLSKFYLEQWNRDKLTVFDNEAQLSQFNNLWRILTCAHLEQLLNEEYPDVNLPMMIRLSDEGLGIDDMDRGEQRNAQLDRDHMFVGVVYRQHLKESGPGLFRNPIEYQSDALTFSQASVFPPKGRGFLRVAGSGPSERGIGGGYGGDAGIDLPDNGNGQVPGNITPDQERWGYENWPEHWDLLNQNWTVQLVPATSPKLPEILKADPIGVQFRPINLGSATMRDVNAVNTH